MVEREVVTDVDLTKRPQKDWENIYHVQIVNGEIESSDIDEFNFAYNLMRSEFYTIPNAMEKHKELDYSIAEEMQQRAMNIYSDIMLNADKAEKLLLKNKYIQTNYVLNYR